MSKLIPPSSTDLLHTNDELDQMEKTCRTCKYGRVLIEGDEDHKPDILCVAPQEHFEKCDYDYSGWIEKDLR